MQDIYLFNSTCELAVANNTVSYMAPQNLRKMERDLAVLSSFFAKADDIVIVPYVVDEFWQDSMRELGFKLPNYLTIETLKSDISKYDIGDLRPWGWSPAAHYFFKDIKEFTSQSFKESLSFSWNNNIRDLYSRKTALSVLKQILSTVDNPLYPFSWELPVVCYSLEDVAENVREKGHFVLKSPWSASGRGLSFINNGEITETSNRWLRGIFRTQSYVMLECWRDKLCDFSLQFNISTSGDIKFLGNSFFTTDSKGVYQGSFLNLDSFADISDELYAFICSDALQDVQVDLINAFNYLGLCKRYSGYLSVDCIIYRERGIIKIMPCLEINFRYNMGLLALELERKLSRNIKGQFIVSMDRKDNSFSDKHISLIPFDDSNSFSSFINLL